MGRVKRGRSAWKRVGGERERGRGGERREVEEAYFDHLLREIGGVQAWCVVVLLLCLTV
jgi:hypothetical protein